MKKNIFLATAVLTIGGLLAACGTSETEQESTGSEQTSPETDPAEETPVENEESGIVEEEPTKAETEGELSTSEEQQYEMYVLPGFQLTAEEPGRDVLMWEEDSSIFMRIETFTKEDIEFSLAESSMKETIAASNPDAEIAEASAPQGVKFLNSVAYEIPTPEGKVTGIVYEKEKLIVRLTIFDNADVNATADFIDMGSTIDRP